MHSVRAHLDVLADSAKTLRTNSFIGSALSHCSMQRFIVCLHCSVYQWDPWLHVSLYLPSPQTFAPTFSSTRFACLQCFLCSARTREENASAVKTKHLNLKLRYLKQFGVLRSLQKSWQTSPGYLESDTREKCVAPDKNRKNESTKRDARRGGGGAALLSQRTQGSLLRTWRSRNSCVVKQRSRYMLKFLQQSSEGSC